EHWESKSPIARAPSDRNRSTLARVSVRRFMSKRSVQRDFAPQHVRRPILRPLRLATGLILFTYATSHFINHAFGIHSVAAFQAAGLVLLKPWQTMGGHVVLYTAFLVHGALGLYALYRRRHLRIPASESWQLALGLAIPLLLIPH